MNNIYYVYIYLDPRKPGTYVYGDYTFDYEPFYVGKGKGVQYGSHLCEGKKYRTETNQIIKNLCPNSFKIFKILKILETGLEPIILKIEDGLFEQDAFDLEIWMIWAIGRNDLKIGPLTNMTNGGEGGSGLIISEETKIKMSKAHKGKIRTEEHQKKLNLSQTGEKSFMWGKHLSEETKKKISTSSKGKIISKETRKKLSIAQTGMVHSEKRKNHSSKKTKEYFENNPDARKLLSEKSKQLWADPIYRQKQIDTRKRKLNQKSLSLQI